MCDTALAMSDTQQIDGKPWLDNMAVAILRGLKIRVQSAAVAAADGKRRGDEAFLSGRHEVAAAYYRGALQAADDRAAGLVRIGDVLSEFCSDAGWCLVGLDSAPPAVTIHRGVGEGDEGLWLDLDDMPRSVGAEKPLPCQVLI